MIKKNEGELGLSGGMGFSIANGYGDRYGVKLLHCGLDLRAHPASHLGHCAVRADDVLLSDPL